MKFNHAIYCSGNATRILKFYKKYKVADFSPEFVVYDGGNLSISNDLRKIFKDKFTEYSHDLNQSKKQQSDIFSNYLLEQFQSRKIDFVFCFGNKILKKKLIEEFNQRIINFHPSLLPKYPGLNAIDQAISNNEVYLGNTAHFVDEGIDTGQIIMQTKIEAYKFLNYDSVLDLQIDMLCTIWETINDDPIKLLKLH